MRTRTMLAGILAAGSVLIVSHQAGMRVVTSDGTSLTAPIDPTPAITPSVVITPEEAVLDLVDGTYTGSRINTRFGDVQVAVTVSAGIITEVAALTLADKYSRSDQTSNKTAPILRAEVIESQSAQVSHVSGATYTSQAYLESVQSALDQAAS
ncbi:FMN-binding protein [Salinibacterium sp. NK8237]|uniref:FMN-binding protein n=1 Tax=Salinibacterium sp. NK8237 TaxID=2792038 RepID=UPI0027DD14B0|nr:FMN-binding protein [Salinibacterium sp. NK8237]